MAIHHTSGFRGFPGARVAVAGQPCPEHEQRGRGDGHQQGHAVPGVAGVRPFDGGTSRWAGEPIEDRTSDRPRLHESLRRPPG
jgi:hypothetical protein